MRVFIKSPTAQGLSKALRELERPLSVRQKGDSKSLFLTERDLNVETYLVVNTEATIRIHKVAVIGPEIRDLLQADVTAGNLPADILTTLEGAVNACREQRVKLWDLLPDFYKAQAKDLPQMIEAGLLNQPGGMM